MATRRTTKKTTRVRKVKQEEVQPQQSIFDYLRFGESYTSLVLGIIVVIVATVLLLAFVHNRQSGKNVRPTEQSQNEPIQISDTVALTVTEEAKLTPTTITSEPTVEATKAPTATPTMKVVNPTATSTPKPVMSGKTYTVVAGDNLWTIAEKTYKSGYNWVDIAKANKLSDPSDIHVGNKLVLPKVTPQVATVSESVSTPIQSGPTKKVVMKPTATPTQAPTATPSFGKKITGDNYTIVHGDDLWDIAVRAYGDGYRWVDIAKANNLEKNPGLIHAGNTIKIPRK
jgi:nucleoid-associated protein YgaU